MKIKAENKKKPELQPHVQWTSDKDVLYSLIRGINLEIADHQHIFGVERKGPWVRSHGQQVEFY